MNNRVNGYIVFDFETGGFSCKKNPAAELAAIGLSGHDLAEVSRMESVIAPYDDNLSYDDGAVRIHGLDRTTCANEGKELKEVVLDFCKVCEEVNEGKTRFSKAILVAHNAYFDIPFLLDIFKRVKLDPKKWLAGSMDYYGNWQPLYIDTVTMSKMMDGGDVGDAEDFKLHSACSRAGIDLVDAHRAMADTASLSQMLRNYINRMRSRGGRVSDNIMSNEEVVNNNRASFYL